MRLNLKGLGTDLRLNKNTGMFSWFLQRVTGILLTLYLFIHIWEQHFALNPETFDAAVKGVQLGAWRLLDIALLVGLTFHGMNGIRVIAVDLIAPAVRKDRAWLYATMAVAVVVIAFGLVKIVPKFYWKG